MLLFSKKYMLSGLDKRSMIFGKKCQDFKQMAFHTALYKCPILFHKLFFFPVAPELDILTNIFYTMMPSSFYSVPMGY